MDNWTAPLGFAYNLVVQGHQPYYSQTQAHSPMLKRLPETAFSDFGFEVKQCDVETAILT